MAEFASKGVAGTALGTGIAGLSLGVLNSLGGLGGMLLGNRVIPFAAGMAAEAGCSENHTVNRYELSMVQENAKLRSDIALRDANTYQDQKMLEMYKYIDGKLGEVFHVYVSFRAHRSIPGLGGAFTTKAIAGGGALIDWGVHYLDIVMYCCGDPKPVTVTGEAFCKLGRDMKNYAYKSMWAENTKNVDGTYDVDDSVTALIRTEGPVITVNGAWAQNIGQSETYIDFMGDKAGIRLQYGSDFTVYTAEHGALIEYKPEFKMRDHFQNEIDAFVDCVKTRKKLPSHIDTVIITARMMQAIYDSSAAHQEQKLD